MRGRCKGAGSGERKNLRRHHLKENDAHSIHAKELALKDCKPASFENSKDTPLSGVRRTVIQRCRVLAASCGFALAPSTLKASVY